MVCHVTSPHVHTNSKMAFQAKSSIRISLERLVNYLEAEKKVMGCCTAWCKMLLGCAKTIARESWKFELPCLKKKKNILCIVIYYVYALSLHIESTKSMIRV